VSGYLLQRLLGIQLLFALSNDTRPRSRPGTQPCQAQSILLLDQNLLGLLVELLRLGKAPDRGIQVTQEALGIGIYLLALLFCEIEVWLLVGSRPEVYFSRLRRRQVRLSNVFQLGMKSADVGILIMVCVRIADARGWVLDWRIYYSIGLFEELVYSIGGECAQHWRRFVSLQKLIEVDSDVYHRYEIY
jgi:hypothetical protein